MFRYRLLISSILLWIIAFGMTACGQAPATSSLPATSNQAAAPPSAQNIPTSQKSTPVQSAQMELITPVSPDGIEGTATTQAQVMYTLIPDLQSKGVNVSKQGAFYKLDDHASQVKNAYSRTLDNIEGFFLSNFILHANLSWDKPEVRMVDLDSSGCGFAFHLNTDGDYELKIRMDGTATLQRLENDTPYTYKAYTLRNEPYRSQFIPQGSEKITLVVNQNLVTFLADDRIIFQIEDEQFSSETYGKGLLAFLIENAQLGGEMNCTWTDVGLWEISSALAGDALPPEATKIPTPVLEAEDYYNQGAAFYKRGDYSQAIVAFTKAIELAPTVYVSYYSRGILYFVRGDYPAALKDFNKTIELAPDLAVAYYRRGQLFQKTGDEEKAKSDFAKATELGYTP
jgi:tetratricopeptide (TPR) repeat protein